MWDLLFANFVFKLLWHVVGCFHFAEQCHAFSWSCRYRGECTQWVTCEIAICISVWYSWHVNILLFYLHDENNFFSLSYTSVFNRLDVYIEMHLWLTRQTKQKQKRNKKQIGTWFVISLFLWRCLLGRSNFHCPRNNIWKFHPPIYLEAFRVFCCQRLL